METRASRIASVSELGTADVHYRGALLGQVRYVTDTPRNGHLTVRIHAPLFDAEMLEGQWLSLRLSNGHPFVGRCIDVSRAPWLVVEQRGPLRFERIRDDISPSSTHASPR